MSIRGVVHKKNIFPIAKKVKWEDVIEKLQHDYPIEHGARIISDKEKTPQTYVSHTKFRPGTIEDVYKKISEDYYVSSLHVFMSLLKDSHTYGMHNDPLDVMLVQSIGTMLYKFDDGEVLLESGDALFISRRVNHCPVILGPRVTLSFDFGEAWEVSIL